MSPEGGEVIASYEYVTTVLKRLLLFKPSDEKADRTFKNASPGWAPEALAADLTDKERMSKPEVADLPRVKAGLPILLKPDYALSRGRDKDTQAPCYLWPSGFKSLDGFVLRNVHLCPRSLVFDFGKCYLNMHYLTHTSIQIYPRDVWDMRVFNEPVSSTARRFRILLAIIFDNYVLAFLSLDMLGQPKWCDTMPTPSPEIFPGWDTEAAILASPREWHEACARLIEKVRKPRGMAQDSKDMVAIYAIRHCDDLVACFPGVGMFVSNELWFRAGLPPGITVWELVSDQTRFPRLLETYYSFIWRCKHNYWSDVICPAMHNQHTTITTYNTMLAPTVEQRITFAETYLDVYQKEVVKVFPRHAKLIDDFEAWTRRCARYVERGYAPPDSKHAPPDPFEPSYIAPALRKVDNFAHLIFGRNAELLAEVPYNAGKDPVSKAYYRLSFGPKPRSSLGAYTKLVLPMQARTGTRSVKHFQAAPGREGNPIWCVLSPHPTRNDKLASEQLRKSKLYHHVILDTQKVTIGPLEYVGYAAPVRVGSTQTLAVSRGDPVLLSEQNAYHTVQSYVGRARRSLRFDCDVGGRSRRALTEDEFARVDDAARALMEKEGYADYVHLVQQYRDCKKLGSFRPAASEDEAPDAIPASPGDVNAFTKTSTGAVKRKRFSVDMHMAAAAGDLVEGDVVQFVLTLPELVRLTMMALPSAGLVAYLRTVSTVWYTAGTSILNTLFDLAVALSPFIDDVPAFHRVLCELDGIIGGSFALDFFRPYSGNCSLGPRKVAVLEVFVEWAFEDELHETLETEGYSLCSEPSTAFVARLPGWLVASVKRFQRGACRIDVVSTNGSPVRCILSGSTATMNFVTWDAAYCLFARDLLLRAETKVFHQNTDRWRDEIASCGSGLTAIRYLEAATRPRRLRRWVGDAACWSAEFDTTSTLYGPPSHNASDLLAVPSPYLWTINHFEIAHIRVPGPAFAASAKVWKIQGTTSALDSQFLLYDYAAGLEFQGRFRHEPIMDLSTVFDQFPRLVTLLERAWLVPQTDQRVEPPVLTQLRAFHTGTLDLVGRHPQVGIGLFCGAAHGDCLKRYADLCHDLGILLQELLSSPLSRDELQVQGFMRELGNCLPCFQQRTIDCLPPETTTYVFEHLSANDRRTVGVVCTRCQIRDLSFRAEHAASFDFVSVKHLELSDAWQPRAWVHGLGAKRLLSPDFDLLGIASRWILPQFASVQHLSLFRMNIVDTFLGVIASSGVRHLSLNRCAMLRLDPIRTALPMLPRLTALDFRMQQSSLAEFVAFWDLLSRVPALASLTVSSSRAYQRLDLMSARPSGSAHFLPNLKVVILVGLTRSTTVDVLNWIGSSAPRLQRLHLYESPRNPGVAARRSQDAREMFRLLVPWTESLVALAADRLENISGDSLQMLSDVAPGLQYLSLGARSGDSIGDVANLGQLASLKLLRMNRHAIFTSYGLLRLASKCRNLVKVALSDAALGVDLARWSIRHGASGSFVDPVLFEADDDLREAHPSEDTDWCRLRGE
ncbi:hypothetical protein AURDEDRAFT_176560 [Auricularia subglabra TFB-10046 SS5]|uniref:Uncharacterized protein n=1 Tax=Auricularia subglabra (strain TFB-10046 / SS5) TaxID=717982 RepID=J0WPN2_AURST|nr:hypothetical protein AURDEDRAFT_176560 [Auricularia subglabra TFB-10046 SS5]